MNIDRRGNTRKSQSQSFQSHFGLLIFLTLIFYLNFFSRVILAPLMPNIEKDLDISHVQAGSFFLMISLGYFPSLMGSGFVSSKLGHHRTISVSAVCLGISLILTSLCHALWSVYAGLLLIGISAGQYLPSGMANITNQFDSGDWGKAFAVHEMGPILSFLTAPLLAEMLLNWLNWRMVLILFGAVGIAAGLAFERFGRGGRIYGEAPRLSALKKLFALPGFWYLFVLFGLGIGGTIGIYSMLPLYLVVEKGLDRSWANVLIAISRISGIGTVFLAGWITDNWGGRKTLIFVFLLSGLATMFLGLAEHVWLIVVVILQPLLASCFFPAGFAVLSQIVPAAIRNLGVSFTVPLGFIVGAGAIPMLIGTMGDAGMFSIGFFFVGLLIMFGTLFAFLLKKSGQRSDNF